MNDRIWFQVIMSKMKHLQHDGIMLKWSRSHSHDTENSIIHLSNSICFESHVNANISMFIFHSSRQYSMFRQQTAMRQRKLLAKTQAAHRTDLKVNPFVTFVRNFAKIIGSEYGHIWIGVDNCAASGCHIQNDRWKWCNWCRVISTMIDQYSTVTTVFNKKCECLRVAERSNEFTCSTQSPQHRTYIRCIATSLATSVQRSAQQAQQKQTKSVYFVIFKSNHRKRRPLRSTTVHADCVNNKMRIAKLHRLRSARWSFSSNCWGRNISMQQKRNKWKWLTYRRSESSSGYSLHTCITSRTHIPTHKMSLSSQSIFKSHTWHSRCQ